MRRLMLGMSQEKLANRLGLTFQQVQKYEKGVNRISSSRLQEIGDILEVPVSFFFERDPGRRRGSHNDEAPLPSYLSEFLASVDGQALAKAFMRLDRKGLKRSIVRLIEAMGPNIPSDPPP